MNVNIYDIQRASMVDGPGIRTCLFFKGCPLRCKWCHNPESMICAPEPAWPVGASADSREARIIGCIEDTSRLVRVIRKDQDYYRESGGGVTISGGEPLMQAEALRDIFSQCKDAGIHTCLDTSGQCSAEDLQAVLSFTDLILWDIKAIPGDQHKKLTGTDGRCIIKNLELINSQGIPVILRCPIIPGLNDSEENFRWIAELSTLPVVTEIQLLPYHGTGTGKRLKTRIGHLQETFSEPSAEQIANWKIWFSSYGVQKLIIL